tara:strand:+ start:147 stop:935 length:789 start_codon:yes stop_codon:yes gene_type:complete
MGFLVNSYSVSASEVSAWSDTYSDDNLKAYYKMNEDSGDVINVSEGTADLGSPADLQLTGAIYATPSTPSAFDDKALSFDGTNDYATAGSSKSQFNFMHNLTSGKSSVNVWVQNDWDTGYGCLYTTAGEGAGTYYGAMVQHTDTSGTIISRVLMGTDPNGVGITQTGYDTDSDFHMLTFVVDMTITTNCIKVYQDGSLLGQANRNNAGVNGNSRSPLNLGSTWDGGSQFFEGDMLEMSIFNEILTPEMITSLYNDGDGRPIY